MLSQRESLGCGMLRRSFLGFLGYSATASLLAPWLSTRALARQDAHLIAPASYDHLPRWRGFNLQEKINLRRNLPFQEWDFDVIAEWGFDFVRLPMDYRIWTIAPGEYREQPLREIDQAVAWARARGIHVNLCLHRAPGYTVAKPPETLNLWADGPDGDNARRQFAAQWRLFAQRYRGIPSSELSFNLVNEPSGTSGDAYLRAARMAVAAIREQDPARLIIADGLLDSFFLRPANELLPLKVAQSMRGYAPGELTLYHASWVKGADAYPEPTWPMLANLNGFLYGDVKKPLQSPLIIESTFTEETQLRIHVQAVSSTATLMVRADNKLIFERRFAPGAGSGEWTASVFHPEWNAYQATYDLDCVANIPAGSQEVLIMVTAGDWLRFSELRFIAKGGSAPLASLKATSTWGIRQKRYRLDAHGTLLPADGQAAYDQQTLWRDFIEPWRQLATKGVGVHVGEWGVHNQTPHAVALAWMKDCLANWKQAGWGWALWDLRGPTGPLDSRRADVKYVNFRGHQLDQAMLELLKAG